MCHVVLAYLNLRKNFNLSTVLFLWVLFPFWTQKKARYRSKIFVKKELPLF